ncbi:methionyl-tRNA formyltransferase [Thermodesulfovibrio thiophilus]|uniref:methionyl-tRNA formyltransferase n=1 Tax=Thermodesulfovibrio thiophilus TaxID=340095 RepID=UPI000421F7DF|nr:methionyl-tRNA formyltransferase [Thermodesulfovibrio thiophilus]
MPSKREGIIFFGTPAFAVPTLNALISDKEKILLVVTQPDKPKGRGKVIQPAEVKKIALEHRLPLIQPDRVRDENFIKMLKELNPEFIVVVAYGKIIPGEILKIPEYGCINLHASLLPKYRGAAPIQWALIKGEKITGVTTMLIDEGLDTGPILLQKEVLIEDEDNAQSFSEKLSRIGADLIVETLDKMRKGVITPIPQSGESSYAPQLKKEDGKINWSVSAIEIFNLIRGTYPWPCAYSFFKNERVKIIKAQVMEGESEPGMIVKAKNELIVATGRGFLKILLIQPEGKKIMTAKEFISGRKINEGVDSFF